MTYVGQKHVLTRTDSNPPEGNTLTRALRSHQLWLTVTYLGLLSLMARGFAS